MYMVPVKTYEITPDGWVLVSETPGDQAEVIAGCAAAGVEIDPEQLSNAFSKSDVTTQDPWIAFGRLGLRLVQGNSGA
jgi:hypothetical protein